LKHDILIAGLPETRVQPASMAPYPAPSTFGKEGRKEQQECVEARKLDTDLVDCVAVTMGGPASATLYGMDASLYDAPVHRLAIDAARVGVQGSRLVWERRIPFHRTKSCWGLFRS
jgi:hypothetical protein